ncbi:transcriptional regulator [Paenibacillus jilunlii]|uniref:Transcriptional regulator n=2 Tax=Paenibacillus jilunlii TaxID=682956 RepID=A0A1G9HE67_9BACL|nr:transcriptional regulator [Paenibacillus jilunlii]
MMNWVIMLAEDNESVSISEKFWNASISELKQGYRFEMRAHSGFYTCLVCGEEFEKGLIYKEDSRYYEAGKYAALHVEQVHGGMFNWLLGLDKKLTGLTELQKGLLNAFRHSLSDGEAAKELGIGSTSTVRNHRFTLREKVKQAKLFLAVMELAEDKPGASSPFVSIPRSAAMVDERFAITEEENAEILSAYFKQGPDGPLSEFPKKQKRKAAILRQLIKRFETGRQYTEKEVNALLKEASPDYVTLRRYLIDYGLLDREPDGSTYWVKL